MRYAFVNSLTKLARVDKRVFLLTGDLGYTVFENFAQEFPDRFINMGVAEANMIGVAAGLASCGKIPFVYSIVNFATMRPFEQIRNDVCAQNLNVKIIGVGGGFSYGHAGLTHHSTEDIGIMRVLPNMTIICPADPLETDLATKAAFNHSGPVYIRLGKSGEPKIHEESPNFQIGKGLIVKEGLDLVIFSTGNKVNNALKVVNELEKEGIKATLVSMHTVKPLDRELVENLAGKNKYFVTLEEHNIIGGLGSAVAEVVSELKEKVVLKRLGVKDQFAEVVGDQAFLRDQYSLSVEKIVKEIKELVNQNDIRKVILEESLTA